MSFLSKIFARKPGGTAVGNFIRGVASTVTGGLLGSGKNMLPAETPAQADVRIQEQAALLTQTAMQNSGAIGYGQQAQSPYLQNSMSQISAMFMPLVFVAALIGGLIFLFKKMFTK